MSFPSTARCWCSCAGERRQARNHVFTSRQTWKLLGGQRKCGPPSALRRLGAQRDRGHRCGDRRPHLRVAAVRSQAAGHRARRSSGGRPGDGALDGKDHDAACSHLPAPHRQTRYRTGKTVRRSKWRGRRPDQGVGGYLRHFMRSRKQGRLRLYG